MKNPDISIKMQTRFRLKVELINLIPPPNGASIFSESRQVCEQLQGLSFSIIIRDNNVLLNLLITSCYHPT